MRRWVSSALLFLLLPLAAAWSQTFVAEEEFVGPFANWANAKTHYGAVGNGVADDTTPLQTALNDLGTAGHASVLYLPAGTYKLTAALHLTAKAYVSIVGEHPATTTLVWAGPVFPAEGSVMLWVDGTAYARVSRLTFDGTNTSYAAIYQRREPGVGQFDTGNEYTDSVYKDSWYGINCGETTGCAEMSVLRNTFLRLSHAGVTVQNFNALDIWIWQSVFQDCAIGISNDPGAGNWRAYGNYFVGSTDADLHIKNTGVFSARYNTSLNSNRFFTAAFSGNPGLVTLQGNTVLDPVQADAIRVSNQGPLVAFDNVIRSRVGATAPVLAADLAGSDLVSLGNTFTVESPISAAGRLLEQETTVLPRTSLAGLGPPTLPATPVSMGRTVVEVTAGSSAATIQAAIDTAVATGEPRPVVHLQEGAYSIASTLTIPAHSTVQLVGDNWGDGLGSTKLTWTGGAGGLLLSLPGPVKATLRDLGFVGNGSKAISASTLDQVGARVALHHVVLSGTSQAELLVDGLDQTFVDVRDLAFAFAVSAATQGVVVVGGPQATAGTPGPGRTSLFSGASSHHQPNYAVSKGATLLVRDFWHEPGSSGFSGFMDLTNTRGTLSYESGRIALPINLTPPAILLNGFQGKAVFLGTLLDDRIVLSGSGSAMTVLALGMVGGATGAIADYFQDSTAPAGNNRLWSSRLIPSGGGSTQYTDEGAVDSTLFTTMLAHLRSETPQRLDTRPACVTDLRAFRVSITGGTTVGITLQGDPPSAAAPLRLVR